MSTPVLRNESENAINASVVELRSPQDAFTDIGETAQELAARNFAFMGGDRWSLERDHPRALADLAESWDRLVVDNYMRNGDTYRRRRFCKYRVGTSPTGSVTAFDELDDFAFYQPPAVNSYAGGVQRVFAPVEPAIRRNPAVRAIVQACLRAILNGGDGGPTTWRVYMHQLRIDCSRSTAGQPTPEGLHRDGHDFISMHLMNRVGVDGGTSRICERDGRTLMTATLERRMDGFLLDDRALLHGVSRITPSAGETGHRDMLILDYNREEPAP